MKKPFFLIVLLAGFFTSRAQFPSTDRITYTISGAGFSGVEETALLIKPGTNSNASSGLGGITFNPTFNFYFTKEPDINSNSFNLAADAGTILSSIEFKINAAGAVTPYMSYQLKNIVLTGFKTTGAAFGGPVLETLSLMFLNYGFKDWVNNVSFGYNVQNRTLTAY
jgi:hypothetical protein